MEKLQLHKNLKSRYNTKPQQLPKAVVVFVLFFLLILQNISNLGQENFLF